MPDSFQSWNLMYTLSERILRANSATEELERWCRERSIGDGQVVARCAPSASPEALDDESLDAIYPHDRAEQIKFRKVRLATAAVVIVEASNWFFPDRLPSDISHKLETTDVPFGKAIKHLNPYRRTFLVRRGMPDQLVDAEQSVDPTSIAFEHRAIVYREDHVPLAVVHERFRAILVMRIPEFVTTSSAKRPPMPCARDLNGGIGLSAGGFRRDLHDFDVVAGTNSHVVGRAR